MGRMEVEMNEWVARFGARFDQRSAAVLASTSGAVILPIFPAAFPSMVRPGLMIWLLVIWAYSALSMVVTAVTGRLTDRLFVVLGAGGMVGVAGSAYVLADPGTAHAVLALLAAIPALAAMHSRPSIVIGFVATALGLAIVVSAAIASTWPELAVSVGATTMAVVIPSALVAALRRSLLGLVDRLETLGDTDPLTGVWNRRGLEARVDCLVEEAVLGGRGVGSAIVDIDFFKTVNDRFGHSAGDRVLVEVAQVVRTGAPAGAIVARVGGEEFLLLTLVDDPDEIVEIAEKIRLRIAEDTSVTVSVGAVYADVHAVSTSPGSAEVTGRELVDMISRAADQHLYASKDAGRDRVESGELPAIGWRSDGVSSPQPRPSRRRRATS